jgi:pyrrolidone-carboxylate peptidase
VNQGVQSGRSDDAGASFCELELYSSLAVCLCRRERLRAAFLHIPSGQLPEDIQTHIAVTETVIKALVEQLGEMDGRS